MSTDTKLKTPFHLAFSDCCGVKKNTSFPGLCQIEYLSEFEEVTSFDHVMGEFTDDYRHKEKFLWADVLPFDIDNSKSDNPSDWISIEQIPTMFPGIDVIIKESRSHLKEKEGKSPRPKFHGYFPTIFCLDQETMECYLKILTVHFPCMDQSVTDASRQFFGSPGNTHYFPGDPTIISFLNSLSLEEK